MLFLNRAIVIVSATALACAATASGCATAATDVETGATGQGAADSGGGPTLGGDDGDDPPPFVAPVQDASPDRDSAPADSGPRSMRPRAGRGRPVHGLRRSSSPPAARAVRRPCASANDAAVGKVSAYGACAGEVPNGCQPGTTEQTSCGLCGKASRVCGNACAWITGQCAGEPANACEPGKEESSGAGCPADQFRSRPCAATCTWSAFSQTCRPPAPRSSSTRPGQHGLPT